MMTGALIAMRGYPGSDRSNFAREIQSEEDGLNTIVINRNALRDMLFDYRNLVLDNDMRREVERKVSSIEHAIVRKGLACGMRVIIDSPNLAPKYTRLWAAEALRFGVDFEICDSLDPIEYCIENIGQDPFGRNTVSSLELMARSFPISGWEDLDRTLEKAQQHLPARRKSA